MGFNRHHSISLASTPIKPKQVVQQIVEEVVDGSITKKVVFAEVYNKDIQKAIPTAEDFSLANQLAAGINLQQVPVSHLLDDTDLVNLEKQQTESLYKDYVNLQNLQYEKDKQSTATDQTADTKVD